MCWWDGGRWVQAKDGGKPFGSGAYLDRLFGGPDRGAYMSQYPRRRSDEHRSNLYRIEGGKAQRIGDYYYDSRGNYPGLRFKSRLREAQQHFSFFFTYRFKADHKKKLPSRLLSINGRYN